MALGPSVKEHQILNQCCPDASQQLFSVNGTHCLRSASNCRVQECTARDPTYACVTEQRKAWLVEGLLGCVAGSKVSGAGKKKEVGLGGWMLVAMMLAFAGIGGM
ncbi:hypothetical protein CC86DRAFT_132413 [Ophiobolus disseminans]|uniref:Uncharacterized protein n=1 Tax=Ophiobolus disseminans TaxID=1469910 RepID=A0A6A6ZF62_9PLEO|nr:hypothetical protein CC86DRAFT_132413 [Ophiobolus disseminans]